MKERKKKEGKVYFKTTPNGRADELLARIESLTGRSSKQQLRWTQLPRNNRRIR
ncbi:hypothetical protein J6590_096864, partial [Homalodisca vitripennis]